MVNILDKTGLTFDDVLLRPGFSTIANRNDEIDISTNFLGRNVLPIISSNMDYVTGPFMAYAMEKVGAVGIISRFEPIESQITGKPYPAYPYISVGVRDPDENDRKIHKYKKIAGICIDVAHGHHAAVATEINRLKRNYIGIKVIAGNVATATGFKFLEEAGADAIKVGIGPGSACTTRTVTGIGVPQLTAIMDCALYKRADTHLIADGGIRSSGDIVKALAAGADSVMLGYMLAGHEETPGENFQGYKPYNGQSIYGSNGHRKAPEGVAGWVPAKGPVAQTIEQLVAGIKSGLSYVGARNLRELRRDAVFQLVSPNTITENSTRILQEV